MMRSLNVKLISAFALVILVGAAITYLVARQAVASQFLLYVSRREQLQATSWAPLFAGYYERTGGWSGVETVLTNLPGTTAGGMMGQGRGGPRHGQGESGGAAGMPGGRGMGAAAEDRVILTDAAGRVVLDSEGAIEGQTLPPGELAHGVPVMVGGEGVGTLLVVAAQSGPSAALAEDFLAALNRGVLLAAIVAGLVALVLGAVLVRQIIAPLRRLQAATGAVARGDLSQRVEISSQDEIGEVGRAFNQMAEALERDEELRRHMMADIAHELRTPLTVMRGQIEALLDGVFPLTAEQLGPIHDETLLLSRLVSDLRELALAEAGQLAIECKPVDMGDLARRVVAAVEPAAAGKDVRLSLRIAPELPTVSVDADRISQVLHNLLANALRHTPAGGQITLAVGMASDSQSPNLPLLIAVSDTGPGIPPEDLPYIFDRFYRADKSRSRAGGGSGLGLTIARYIVEAHGGRIWAESRVGEGTHIAFTLPSGTHS